jgi:pyruvate formate lyase activating enzyme
MTGDVFDLRKFSIHDGPGIRTTVFFRGCPLSCWWCHNPEGIGLPGGGPHDFTLRKRSRPVLDESSRFIGPGVGAEAVMTEILKDSAFYDKTGGGATFSGGEPMMQAGFLGELLSLCAGNGIETALDTSGYSPWSEFKKIEGMVDLFLFDLKLIDDGDHVRYTGVSNSVIHENLAKLHNLGRKIWIRVPLIPGITDGPGEIDSIVAFLRDYDKITKVCLLPYNRMGEDKFARLNIVFRPGRLQVQDDGFLRCIRDKFMEAGFDASIGG